MAQNELELQLHSNNFTAVGQRIRELLSGGGAYRLIIKPWRERRSLPQNATLHMWFGEISDYLIKSGRADATPEWVKRNLKKTYLGCQQVTYTDFVTGQKDDSWQPRSTSSLDTAEMHYFMMQIEGWCAQFGLALTIPANCEYMQLRDRQEA